MDFIEKEISSEDGIYNAIKLTEKLALDHGFSFRDAMKLQLVTEEACTNSFEYCLRENIPSFSVKWKLAEGSAEITVRQRGCVFPLAQREETGLGLRGRGITLILNLMDKVEVREDSEYVELYMRKRKGD